MAIFGGMTPVISTYLIEKTGDKAAPAYWMTTAAVCGLIGAILLYRRKIGSGPSRFRKAGYVTRSAGGRAYPKLRMHGQERYVALREWGGHQVDSETASVCPVEKS